jgi:hypothetical protein
MSRTQWQALASTCDSSGGSSRYKEMLHCSRLFYRDAHFRFMLHVRYGSAPFAQPRRTDV